MGPAPVWGRPRERVRTSHARATVGSAGVGKESRGPPMREEPAQPGRGGKGLTQSLREQSTRVSGRVLGLTLACGGAWPRVAWDRGQDRAELVSCHTLQAWGRGTPDVCRVRAERWPKGRSRETHGGTRSRDTGLTREHQTGAHVFAGTKLGRGERAQVPRCPGARRSGRGWPLSLARRWVHPLSGTGSWVCVPSFIPIHIGALGCRPPPASRGVGAGWGLVGEGQTSPPEAVLSGRPAAEAGREARAQERCEVPLGVVVDEWTVLGSPGELR